MPSSESKAIKPKKNFRTPEQKRRRKVLAWFQQLGWDLRDAINEAAPGLDFRDADADRIIGQFAAVLDTFTGGGRNEFRAWASDWVKRIAGLTAAIRSMTEVPLDVSCALEHLPEFDGAPDDLGNLRTWAVELSIREGARKLRNDETFREWYRLHQRAVFAGIRRIIKSCPELWPGQPGPYSVDDVVEEIATDFWIWAAGQIDVLLIPGAPIHIRLRDRAAWEARRWKQARIRKLEKEPEFSFAGVEDESDLDYLSLPSDGRVKPKPIAA
jgi:hypothetical protein